MERIICDAATIDLSDAALKPRRTKDGYLAASVKVARTGIQIYTGDEVGRPDLKTVRVYRPPEEVFAKDSLGSYANKPITVNHPSDQVTSKTWGDHAVGNMGDVLTKDGEFVRVPILLMDEDAINLVDAGKRELSMGYSCDLVFEDGETPEGLKFDAIQRSIRANHLAIVTAARGGSALRIGDKAVTEKTTRTVLVDGIPVEANDASALVIEKLIKDRADRDGQIAALNAKVADGATALATKDGEIAALKQKLTDSTLTDAQIDARAEQKAKTIGVARAILGDKADLTGKTEIELKRLVVGTKLGDAAKTMDEAVLNGAYGVIAADVKPAATTMDPVRQAMVAGGGQQNLGDAQQRSEDAWRKANEEMANAYKNPPATAH